MTISEVVDKIINALPSEVRKRPLRRSELIRAEKLLKRLAEEHGIRRSRQ